LRQNPSRGLGCSELQESPKTEKKLTRFGAQSHACAETGLSVVGGQILGFSIDLHRRPYNTLASVSV